MLLLMIILMHILGDWEVNNNISLIDSILNNIADRKISYDEHHLIMNF